MKILNKKHTRRYSRLSVILLLFGILVGCKTSRQVTVMGTKNMKEAEAFFFSIQQRAFQYRTFSARTRIELNLSGRELSSRVDIKMIKDSVFQLSVLPFPGVEIFRIEFGVDSVKAIDRMNKHYVLESYDGLKGSMPINFNFYNLQALFTNHIFVPGEREITPAQYNRFTLEQDETATQAKLKDAMKMRYAFKADGEEKLITTYVTDPSEHYTLQWIYADFRQITEEQIFPMQMEARMLYDGIPAGEINLYFSRIQRNIPVEMSFPIPEKYKRITFAEIIKGIKQ